MKFHQSNFFAKERVLKSTDIVSHGLFSISGTLFLESDAAAVVVVFFFLSLVHLPVVSSTANKIPSSLSVLE